tara:strand:- start:1549 stop:2160 length:612 start_codon:yes stop_codon:yes gene_type:complete
LKKNKISKNWINKQKSDIYVRKAKIEGYRSRAVFKLIEINEKFKILKNGISLVDLGAAPGSWSQYISKRYKNIKLLAIDLKKMEEIPNTKQILGDFNELDSKKKIKDYFKSKIDVVLSDMAENTTGIKNLDVISTSELCKEAMYFAKDILKDNGVFVCKIFMGSTFNEIMDELKLIFRQIKVFKPTSSRKDSKESFIICKILR